MSIANETQIKALIKLLEDENARVVATIRHKLVEIGGPAVPWLQEAEIERPDMAARIAGVLDEIRGSQLEREFAALAVQPDDRLDLERGVFLLARFAYPALDVPAYVGRLDAMAADIQDRLGPRMTDEETVKTLNRALFTELGFRGNSKNYYDVDNSYVNRVLDRRTGIPISLSAVYLLIGRRLCLPVFGIGMPGHFLVSYESARYRTFVDCFNGGALLTEKDCARFLVQAGYGFEDRFLARTPVRTMLIRMLKNLVAIYQKTDDQAKETRLSRFMELLEQGGSGDGSSIPA